MADNIQTYGQAQELIASYFEEHLQTHIKDVREEFSMLIRRELTSLRSDLYRIKKDDEDRYIKVLRRIDESVRFFTEHFASEKQYPFAEQWTEKVQSSALELPEFITAPQHTNRFTISDGDSFRISVLKRIKNTTFNLYKAFLKKSERDTYSWKQVIPLRNLVIYALIGRKNTLLQTTAFEYSRIARAVMYLLNEIKEEVLEEIEEMVEKEPGTSENGAPDATQPFRLPLFTTVESHLADAIAELEHYPITELTYNPIFIEIQKQLKADVEIAGTVEFANKKLDEDNLSQSVTECLIAAEKNILKWHTYIHSQITDLQVQSELARFGAELQEGNDQLLEQSHKFFRDVCYLPTEDGINILVEIIEKLETQKTATKSLKEIESARDRLQNDFLEKSLYIMQDDAAQELFISEAHRIISDLELDLNIFSENLDLAEKREFILPEPKLDLDDFAWRSIASRFLKNEALKQANPENYHFKEFIANQLSDIEEAANIVDVNLQAALTSEEKTGEDSPLEIAVSGLERAVSTLEKSIKNIREKQNDYENLIKQNFPESFQKLSLLMLERKYDEFEYRDKALMAKETALGWKDRITKLYALTEDKAELAWRYLTLKFIQAKAPVLKFLGFSAQHKLSTRHRLDVTKYLSQTRHFSDSLPFIYQRLFKRSFVIDRRFFVDSDSNIKSMLEGYRQWSKNIDWNLTVVGQKGSGKSTLIHFFSEEKEVTHEIITVTIDYTLYDPKKLISLISKSLGFSETNDVNELIEKIHKSRKKRIVVLEGLQNTYIRNINGYDAIKEFWVLLSQTSKKLFWIVTSSGNAWNFFTKMFNADQFFSQIIRTDQITRSQLEEGIMLRHRATGYELEFTPSEAIRKSRAYRKLLGNEKATQEYLRNEYFESLAKIADGNFSIAMIFWMNSIKSFDDTSFTMAPIQVADIDILEVPSRDVLFTLATLICHDTLSMEEVAMSLHQNVSESKLMLGRLKSKGLVVETSKGYTVNHLVYRQIIRLLTSRNILH